MSGPGSLNPFLTGKPRESVALRKGEKGEGVLPSLYIFYALFSILSSFSFHKKWSLTTLTFLTIEEIPGLEG